MTGNLLAIDPGRCAGWALFREGKLRQAGVTSVDDPHSEAFVALVTPNLVTDFVIEIPQVYRASQSKGDPNDLIKLAVGAGRWIERATLAKLRVHTHLPAEWKGQIKKTPHHARVMTVLGEVERMQLPRMAEDKRHNMLDAVALGLFQLGRLPKTGYIGG